MILYNSQLQAQILLISEPTQIANDWRGVRRVKLIWVKETVSNVDIHIRDLH